MAQSGEPDDPLVIAASDQLNAAAIDALRHTREFGLVFPTEVEGEAGLAIMFSGPISMMLEMHMLLTQQLAASAARQFLQDFERDTISRDVLDEYFNFYMQKGGEKDGDASD